MLKRFSSSAAVSYLDRDGALAWLRDAALELGRSSPKIIEVRLFGSLARGNHGRRSDADLLVLLESSTVQPRDRIAALCDAFADAPVPVDLFPLTVAEVTVRRAAHDSFLRTIDREGITLYHRDFESAV
jgi:predicted nucleotidyltransferase